MGRAPRTSGLVVGLVDFVGWNFVGDSLAENWWRSFPSGGTLGHDFFLFSDSKQQMLNVGALITLGCDLICGAKYDAMAQV